MILLIKGEIKMNKKVYPNVSKKLRYWNELTQEQQTEAFEANALVSEFIQPFWCEYPDALQGGLGCWSLVDKIKFIGEIKDCITCKFNKESKINTEQKLKDQIVALKHRNEQTLSYCYTISEVRKSQEKATQMLLEGNGIENE